MATGCSVAELEEKKVECVQRFTDLGLGRGIDATSSKPWQEKSSFQVRKIKFDNIIRTEEGGAVEAYENKVKSVQTLQMTLKASVIAPGGTNPVTVSTDGETVRSSATEQMVIGRRVHNVTVSFAEEIERPASPLLQTDTDALATLSTDSSHTSSNSHSTQSTYLPLEAVTTVTTATGIATLGSPMSPVLTELQEDKPSLKGKSPSLSKDTICSGPPSFSTRQVKVSDSFEESLSSWVIHNLVIDYPDLCHEEYARLLSQGVPGSELIKQWLRAAKGSMDTFRAKRLLIDFCYKFVSHFKFTHFVSSIKLGAMEYTVMTLREYTTHLSHTSSAGVLQGTMVGSFTKSNKKQHHLLLSRRIGIIQNDSDGRYTVPRETYAEAVIQAEFKPITSLICNPHLRRSLRGAISKYITKRADCSAGPFLISAEGRFGEMVFLTVYETDMSLHATTNPRKASCFNIVPFHDKPPSFHIVYLKSTRRGARYRKRTLSIIKHDKHEGEKDVPIQFYLTTPTSMFGFSQPSSLKLEINPKQSDTLFQLHSRLCSREQFAERTTPWVQGREAFFIKCSSSSRLKKASYLTIKKREVENGEVVFSPICAPKRKLRKERKYYFTFRLVSPTTKGLFVKDLVQSEEEEEEKDDEDGGKSDQLAEPIATLPRFLDEPFKKDDKTFLTTSYKGKMSSRVRIEMEPVDRLRSEVKGGAAERGVK